MGLGDPTAVAEEHEAETHDHGDAVEAGRGVEIVPGGDEGVAVKVKEGAEEDGRDDMKQLRWSRWRFSYTVASSVNDRTRTLTLNISYHRLRKGVNEAKHNQVKVTSMATPVQ
jgi:hypothetical protein